MHGDQRWPEHVLHLASWWYGRGESRSIQKICKLVSPGQALQVLFLCLVLVQLLCCPDDPLHRVNGCCAMIGSEAEDKLDRLHVAIDGRDADPVDPCPCTTLLGIAAIEAVFRDLVLGNDQVARFRGLGLVDDRIEARRIAALMMVLRHCAEEGAELEQLVLAIEGHRSIPVGFDEEFLRRAPVATVVDAPARVLLLLQGYGVFEPLAELLLWSQRRIRRHNWFRLLRRCGARRNSGPAWHMVYGSVFF